ncbi:MAG: UDP-N-acetylmuramoyl-tripeptide--D-alanyl-D-alanine ligase [Clostridia bacterium]|nr:UDP-N-acetylmuramoyl-tripeptide--D-alanyl-D-alanine ligase [Clostridia bacterium]
MAFFNLTNPDLYIAIIFSICNGIALCFCGYKFLQIIQLSGYKISGYWVWLKDTHAKFINRIIMLSFMSFACMLVTATLFDYLTNTSSYLSYIGLIFYVYFITVYTVNMYNTPKKTPLVQTYRMTRLCVLLALLMAGLTFIIIALSTEFLPILRIASVALTPLLLPIIVPLAHFIMVPFEILNYKKYILLAKMKLNKYPNLVKIGITGSYGKTSTKYILNTILSERYSVCISPHSFNTPMGITKVILEYLKPNNDVLIVEMGAKQVGDIKYLCDIVNPKYGILTSVGNQHSATFLTIDNIKKTKNELIKSLPDDGLAIFNGDNKICMDLYNDCKINKKYSSLNNKDAFARAEDIKISNRGISFKLIIDKNEIECTTKLLGSHNLTNILMSATLAYNLGLSLQQIQIGISKLEPVNHRLELRKENGLNILDDSYNSNIEGSMGALEVLKLFEKGNKIVVTPGLVELGIKEKEENINFGKNLSKVANFVIIVNKTNQESIKQGLIDSKFPEENILCVDTIIEAKLKLKEIAKSGDTILFENDLPDNYT